MLFVTILFSIFVSPMMVKAANDFGLSDDYKYYCKYDLESYINGGTSNEEKYTYDFYVYVYENRIETILNDVGYNSYNFNNCDSYQCIIKRNDKILTSFSNSPDSLESFFDKESKSCPNIYVDTSGYTEYIQGTSCTTCKSYTSTDSGLGSNSSGVEEVTDGVKWTKSFHFSEDTSFDDIKDKTITLSFYYNSKNQKCFGVQDSFKCSDNIDSESIPIHFNRTGGGTYTVYFGFKTITDADKIYSGNSYSSFQYSGDLYFETIQNAPVLYVYISTEKVSGENTYEIKEGEGSSGNLGESTGTTQADPGNFNPQKVCENGNCDISLETFCTTNTVARTFKFLGLLIYIAKILVPGILVVVGMINLFKVIASGKEEDAKKMAKGMFIKIIIGIGIFLIPGIVDTVYSVARDVISDSDSAAFDNCEACLLTPNSSDCKIDTSSD